MSDAVLRGVLSRLPPFVASQRTPGRSTRCMALSNGPVYCIPSEGHFCRDCSWSGGTCYNGECEGLHELEDIRAHQKGFPVPDDGKVIIAAGPERSGSTWLFNAIRLLCHDAQQPLDPFWISHLTDSLLQDRSAGSVHVPHILVKTHAWSDDWDPESATHIFLTHRDLRGVLASYQRVGWAFDITQAYVTDHMRWRDIAQHDFAFEDIVSTPAHQLQILAQRLDIQPQSDWTVLAERINALKPPPGGPPDPVTKLWPRHLSKEVIAQQQGSSEQQSSTSQREGRRSLKERFPEYFTCYGYS